MKRLMSVMKNTWTKWFAGRKEFFSCFSQLLWVTTTNYQYDDSDETNHV